MKGVCQYADSVEGSCPLHQVPLPEQDELSGNTQTPTDNHTEGRRKKPRTRLNSAALFQACELCASSSGLLKVLASALEAQAVLQLEPQPQRIEKSDVQQSSSKRPKPGAAGLNLRPSCDAAAALAQVLGNGVANAIPPVTLRVNCAAASSKFKKRGSPDWANASKPRQRPRILVTRAAAKSQSLKHCSSWWTGHAWGKDEPEILYCVLSTIRDKPLSQALGVQVCKIPEVLFMTFKRLWEWKGATI